MEVKSIDKFEEELENMLGEDSIKKGKKLFDNAVLVNSFERNDGLSRHIFSVRSEQYTYRRYYVDIIINDNNDIESYSCECKQYYNYDSCKHIAACLLKYKDKIFPDREAIRLKKMSDFLNSFKATNNKDIKTLKERVGIDVEVSPDTNQFKLSIGLTKKYVLNTESKYKDFLDALDNNKEYEFGKGFTYDPKKHYINDEDMELINFLRMDSTRNYSTNVYRTKFNELSNKEFITLLDKIKNRKFKITGEGVVEEVKKEFPLMFSLTKEENNYVLNVTSNSPVSIYNDYNYCYKDKKLYIIPSKYQKILSLYSKYKFKKMTFPKELLPSFKEGLLKDIKSKLEISDEITDIKITKDPVANFYFDLTEKGIFCDLKINYDDEIINYFDKNGTIVRDIDYENKCIESLLENKFELNKNKISLNDIDDIGSFLENGISTLSQKYNVFTSQKLDNTRLLKKVNVESAFSIGKDGILSYSFSSDNIDNKEILSIVSKIKAKKKYYKLKNGNIINLNDESIKDLGEMINDLDIDNIDKDGNAIIPKYKAFYIDSLKSSKYKSIKTDNSFNNFINNFKKYKDIEFKLSKDDEKILRDYQKDGTKWLYTLYKCDLGGILADEMGLGKSIQTIMFIKKVIEEKKDAKILIVCPTSLVYNWKKEFDKFGSELKYVTVHDTKEKRKEVIDNIDNYNVIITSYGLIRNDNDEYEKIDFEVCIIDEAQAIKNYQAGITKEVKKIKAKFHLALTGTPVENSIYELWSIFDYLMPGYLNNIDTFRKIYGISDIDDKSLEIIKKLNYQVKPFILRRKKIDVIKDLPDKIENNVYLELSDIQKGLYQKETEKTKKEMENLIKEEGFTKARFKILQLLLKLRQICIDPSLIYDNYNETAVKMENLKEIVKDLIANGHKMLIFSNFKMVIDKVEKLFKKENISFYTITGEVDSKKRMELVEKFNSDDTNCFLITLKSGGTGLNLTGADTVIHLDIWWNPQVENQATDRAHRIGQKKIVTVMKLVTKGTIEEKIIELQQKKKILADNLLEGDSDSKILSSLSEGDVRNLLSFSYEE